MWVHVVDDPAMHEFFKAEPYQRGAYVPFRETADTNRFLRDVAEGVIRARRSDAHLRELVAMPEASENIGAFHVALKVALEMSGGSCWGPIILDAATVLTFHRTMAA
jgi:hypothetical protein